jgi:carboxyl-terminal processing protease
MRTLVLDLRGNRGGDPQAALRLADDLLDRGLPLCRLIDPDGDERIIRARRAVRYDLPLLLLVDGRTASAAEILTGALLQHHRAVVIGQPTAGKGTAQALLPSPEGRGVLYATVASFRLPDGALLDGAPIRPDIEIPAGAQNEQELEGALLRLLGDLPNLSSLADLVLRRLSDDPIDGAP